MHTNSANLKLFEAATFRWRETGCRRLPLSGCGLIWSRFYVLLALNVSLFVHSHIECSRVQSFLSDKDSLPLSTAARVVIKEILSMYRDILAFLHSVVQLNTIFCFDLLQDQETLDRIVRLCSICCPCTG